jgi:uncharacterized protein YeaO (DUF488 family)
VFRHVAPSTDLRKWFGHDRKKWSVFQRRNRAELKKKDAIVREALADAAGNDITLVYTSREQKYNYVTMLKEVLNERSATQ